MNHKPFLARSPIFILSSLVILSFFPVVFGATPGPTNPGSDTAITQYCSTGVCSVNGLNPFFNGTRGFFAYGNYTGGIFINKSTLYAIQLSKACMEMEKNHIPSNCPTYDKMLFMDNTNPNYAGRWVNDTWFHRLAPMTPLSWNFNNGKNVVMVDPDADFTARAKNIIIQNGPFTYINPDQNVTNHIRVEYHDRFVSADCASAIVAPNIWLINDTLHYLESNCKVTKFNGTSLVFTPIHALNYNTMNVKTTNYLSQFSNVTRMGNCITEKCNITNEPYHNRGFGW